MITYTSISFYYFIFICVCLIAWLKNVFSKKDIILFFNLIFHFLFFYFNKINFLAFFSLTMLTWIFIKLSLRTKNNVVFVYSALGLNIVFFILAKYNLFESFTLLPVFQKLAFIGYSFFLFRIISILVDIKRDVIKKICFKDYINYISFFPTFLSGPLDRFNQFNDEIEKEYAINDNELLDGAFRVTKGVFKKVVIADLLFPFSIENISI